MSTGKGGLPIRVITLTSANADQTASFNTDVFDLEEMTILYATLDGTEDSGTATVDVAIQSSPDRTNWFATGTTFTQLTATGSETKNIVDGKFHRYVRFAVTVGGSGQWDVDFYVTGKKQF